MEPQQGGAVVVRVAQGGERQQGRSFGPTEACSHSGCQQATDLLLRSTMNQLPVNMLWDFAGITKNMLKVSYISTGITQDGYGVCALYSI